MIYKGGENGLVISLNFNLTQSILAERASLYLWTILPFFDRYQYITKVSSESTAIPAANINVINSKVGLYMPILKRTKRVP